MLDLSSPVVTKLDVEAAVRAGRLEVSLFIACQIKVSTLSSALADTRQTLNGMPLDSSKRRTRSTAKA